MKILINNEEVVCKNNLVIKEKMLSTSSTILNNCYPKTWENDKDYTTRFYYPKDYSKCKIVEETYHPYIPGTTEKNTMFNFNYDTTKQWQLNGLFGNTIQDGTPTPSSPVPIQSVTGLQNVEVCGENLLDDSTFKNRDVPSNQGFFINGFSYTIKSGIYRFGVFVDNQLVTTNSIVALSFRKGATSVLEKVRPNEDFEITNEQASQINNISIYLNNTFVSTYSGKKITGVMITKSEITTYEPYKGNNYDINLGKNLFEPVLTIDGTNINLTNCTVNKNNDVLSFTATAKDWHFGDLCTTGQSYQKTYGVLIEVNEGETYSFTFSNTNIIKNYITFYNANKISLGYVYKDTNSFTYTMPSDTKYISLRIGLGQATVVGETYTTTIQIEKGTQATSYSPYFTPIELNKIGNYEDKIYKQEDKWYIYKEVGKAVFDGSENWVQRNNGDGSTTITFQINLNTGAFGSENEFCNKFVYEQGSSSGNEGIGIASQLDKVYIQIKRNRLSSLNVTGFKSWLSSNNTEFKYVLSTPITEQITDEDLINQLESIYQMTLKEGTNNISVTSYNLPIILEIHYNYKDAWTEEDIIFCGCVKNTGKISLNPREPHYCDLQVLDFKTLLSEGETLNYVITNKTITEAIKQVVGSISDYGFVVGNIEVSNPDDVINAYSTLNKTAYDVFQYIADITQSRWFTRLVDENTIAIDFYDPSLMTQADPIEYTQEYFEENEIVDMSFNYSTNDYRNKQIMTSDEVYGNIELTETKIADGYAKTYMCDNKIGDITKITVNGVSKTVITKEQKNYGISGDFIYQPGENTFVSSSTQSSGSVIVVKYYPIVKGREIILDAVESDRIGTQIDRKGTISRYENRNDTTTSQELQKIGQSYLKFKGKPQITLKIQSTMNLFNIGDVVNFEAPINELSVDYMVKNKTTNMYITGEKTFYTFELVNNFNSEDEINYFDNQRAKSQGNIGEGEQITRNIDLESTALIKFYDTSIEEVSIGTLTTLDFQLDSVL